MKTPPFATPSSATAATTSFAGGRCALLLLVCINLLNYIDRYVLSATVAPIKNTFFDQNQLVPAAGRGDALVQTMDWFQHRLGFSPEDALIGLLGTAFMVVYMIGAPIFGRLAERHSRWMLVGVGVILWSLASGASGLAGAFVGLLLTRCFVGIGEAAYGPVAPTILSDFYPVKVRGRVLAIFYMAIPVGSALGYEVGGWLGKSNIGPWGARVLGTPPESWRWAFYVVVIPGILLGLWSLFMREPPRGQADLAHGEKPVVARGRDYLILLRTPSYVLCTIGMTAMTFAMAGIAFWMPYYLVTRPGAPASAILIFGGITAVAGLAGTLLGGLAGDKLRDRFSGSYFLVSGLAMFAGFPFLLLTLRAAYPWIWVWLFVTCFCLFFNTGPTNTILANVTHPGMRATAFALNILIIHALGDAISPVVIGLLNGYFGDMTKSFVVVGVTCLVAGAVWLWGARHLARDTTKAPHRLEPAHGGSGPGP